MHFDSLYDFLGYLAETRHIDHGGAQSATEPDDHFHGPALETFVQQCATLGGELPGLIARVDALVDSILPALPPTDSLTRERHWRKQGAQLNPHRVLRGQLSTAWRKTQRRPVSDAYGPVSVVLPIWYACAHDQRRLPGHRAGTPDHGTDLSDNFGGCRPPAAGDQAEAGAAGQTVSACAALSYPSKLAGYGRVPGCLAVGSCQGRG